MRLEPFFVPLQATVPQYGLLLGQKVWNIICSLTIPHYPFARPSSTTLRHHSVAPPSGTTLSHRPLAPPCRTALRHHSVTPPSCTTLLDYSYALPSDSTFPHNRYRVTSKRWPPSSRGSCPVPRRNLLAPPSCSTIPQRSQAVQSLATGPSRNTLPHHRTARFSGATVLCHHFGPRSAPPFCTTVPQYPPTVGQLVSTPRGLLPTFNLASVPPHCLCTLRAASVSVVFTLLTHLHPVCPFGTKLPTLKSRYF